MAWGADQLFGRWYFRKGADQVIAILKMVRARYPGQRIWVIQDNPPRTGPRTCRRGPSAAITLVPTPTSASWLNRIECHFGVIVKAVFAGSDYHDHAEIQSGVAAFLHRRNAEGRRDHDERRAGNRLVACAVVGPRGATKAWPESSHSIIFVAIPERARLDLERRLEAHRKDRWPTLRGARVRFRAPYAYIEGTPPDSYDQPLFRLRWTGHRDHRWAFALWLASKDDYERSILQWLAGRHCRRGHGLRVRSLPQRRQCVEVTPSAFRAS